VNDPSESVDVAAQFPEKLRELQRLWIEESMKYNVFPLNDNLGERLRQAYVHFAPR
jgi:arylsulfatase